jgi:hypothetical protein
MIAAVAGLQQNGLVGVAMSRGSLFGDGQPPQSSLRRPSQRRALRAAMFLTVPSGGSSDERQKSLAVLRRATPCLLGRAALLAKEKIV